MSLRPMPTFEDGATRTGHWLHIVARGDRLLHCEFDEKAKKDVDLFEVCDDVCIRKMLDSFAEQKARPGFTGLLLDFDHSSLDADKPTEAAGWLMDAREVPDGIEYLTDFSDVGWAAVRGKRYKFCSKVFANPPEGAEIIAANTFRPTVLDRAALTNDPRSKSLRAFGQAFIDRAAHGASPAREKPANAGERKKDSIMDYKAQLLAFLKLPAEATDEQITAAIATRNQELADSATTKAEAQKLQDRLKTQGEELADGDCDRYAAVIKDRKAMREALIADRAGTLKILRNLTLDGKNPALRDRAPGDETKDKQKSEEPTGLRRTAAAFKKSAGQG